jgi:hypothetical protein
LITISSKGEFSSYGGNPDEALTWEVSFKCLGEILMGKESRVLEASRGWRECLVAWVSLVRRGVARGDLGEVMQTIEETHPVDQGNKFEVIQSLLLKNEITEVRGFSRFG